MTSDTPKSPAIQSSSPANSHLDAGKFGNPKAYLLSGIIPPIGLAVAVYLVWRRGLKRIALWTLAISLVLAGLYVFIYLQFVRGNNPNAYTYRGLKSVSLSGGKASTGMTFSEPTQFSASLNTSSFKIFKHTTTKTIAIIAASDSALLNPQYGLGSVIDPLNAGPTDKDYVQVVKPISDYAQTVLSNYKVSLSSAQLLKTSNLGQNAWQFNVTATSSANQQVPQMQGKLIYVLGKNAIYYFMVMATPDNWSHNSGVWQQVDNSIKVDQ